MQDNQKTNELPKEITPKLTLTGISAHDSYAGRLIVKCDFMFYGEEGEAYISMGSVDDEYPSYEMTEMTISLASSFRQLLEDCDNWDIIRSEVKKFTDNK